MDRSQIDVLKLHLTPAFTRLRHATSGFAQACLQLEQAWVAALAELEAPTPMPLFDALPPAPEPEPEPEPVKPWTPLSRLMKDPREARLLEAVKLFRVEDLLDLAGQQYADSGPHRRTDEDRLWAALTDAVPALGADNRNDLIAAVVNAGLKVPEPPPPTKPTRKPRRKKEPPAVPPAVTPAPGNAEVVAQAVAETEPTPSRTGVVFQVVHTAEAPPPGPDDPSRYTHLGPLVCGESVLHLWLSDAGHLEAHAYAACLGNYSNPDLQPHQLRPTIEEVEGAAKAAFPEWCGSAYNWYPESGPKPELDRQVFSLTCVQPDHQWRALDLTRHFGGEVVGDLRRHHGIHFLGQLATAVARGENLHRVKLVDLEGLLDRVRDYWRAEVSETLPAWLDAQKGGC